MFNTTFSETYVASYLKTKMNDYEKKMEKEDLSEDDKMLIKGKMEAYQEFLDHFELDRYELKEEKK
ncbi:hypothetical protein [Falsibacillus albus]|uniref:Uncharacterized protein n=1 Tax=Falsibacillus albus TaxID=2478915 RepID=A0A3L7JSA5_9BACI|nr:hypothetical protein [Falsibacillus albus]RLQ93204.1 hypothetical protein D9X91_18400 [Falsibacillus albus]